MSYTVKIVFGKEQVLKFYNDEDFSQDEKINNIKFYEFDSEKEKTTFCQGIEEAIGWTDCLIVKEEFVEHK